MDETQSMPPMPQEIDRFSSHMDSRIPECLLNTQNGFEERMIENGGNVETWYVEDRAHVDAMWSDSEEYENRLTSFFQDAFGM